MEPKSEASVHRDGVGQVQLSHVGRTTIKGVICTQGLKVLIRLCQESKTLLIDPTLSDGLILNQTLGLSEHAPIPVE